MADIFNEKSNTLVSGTSSADSISNGGYDSNLNWYDGGNKVTIDAGAGNDSIYNNWGGNKVTINAGDGDDQISLKASGNSIYYSASGGNDTIFGFNESDTLHISGGKYSTQKSGDDVLVQVGTGSILLKDAADKKLSINEYRTTKLITLTKSGDEFKNKLINVAIQGLGGHDSIINESRSDCVTIDGDAGNDFLYTYESDRVTLLGGAGSDLFIYFAEGDEDVKVFNDIITDYEEEDTIQFDELSDSAVSSITTNDSGSVIFKVGKNKLVVKNAADKVITYIDSDGTTKTFGGSSADEWKLDGTTATYGSLTVKGVTSLDGLKVSGKVVTVSAASLGTKKISVSDGYTLALGSDVSSSTTKKSWTLKNSTATYKQTTTAGYSLEDKAITYTEKSSAALATVKGVKSLDGLKLSGSTVKLAGDALSKKVTVSGAYNLRLFERLQKRNRHRLKLGRHNPRARKKYFRQRRRRLGRVRAQVNGHNQRLRRGG